MLHKYHVKLERIRLIWRVHSSHAPEIESMTGVRATCRGVMSRSCGKATSPIPSISMKTIFLVICYELLEADEAGWDLRSAVDCSDTTAARYELDVHVLLP